MTLQEWKAQQGHGRSAMTTPPAPAATVTPEDDLTPGPLGEMRHANSGDDYTSAFEGELLRTGKEAAIGLARSPVDLVKGLANTVIHPLDTLMGLGHTIAHPVEAVTELAKHPRDAGSLLGQTLLAPKVPGAANTALAEGPTLAGRAISATGRGAEALGKSKLGKMASKYGPMEAVFRGDPYGAAVAAAPKVLEYGGKGLQKLGGAMEGLDLSFKKAPPIDLVPESRRLNPARVSTETRNYGREMDTAAGSWERSPSDAPLAPGRRNPSIDGLESAAGDNAWAGDKSASTSQFFDVPGETGATRGVVEPNAFTAKSPIEQFYESDPQARTGGEGRMTGQFKEGSGGLADVAAGKMARYGESPELTQLHQDAPLNYGPDSTAPQSTLDELARLSGRQLTPERMNELLRKFGGAGS